LITHLPWHAGTMVRSSTQTQMHEILVPSERRAKRRATRGTMF
jgi:hypothetical protein